MSHPWSFPVDASPRPVSQEQEAMARIGGADLARYFQQSIDHRPSAREREARALAEQAALLLAEEGRCVAVPR